MAIVYRHRNKITNEVFYIGIGTNERRANRKDNRNIFWKRTVDKYGYTIEIIQQNLSWEDACELEEFLISLYGRRDLGTGTLVNLTNGGEGVLGFKMPKEIIEKIRQQNLGRKHTIEEKLSKSKISGS